MVNHELIQAIDSIKADATSIWSYDEAKVKNAIILNLLFKLGWNVFNANEVAPEYNVGSGKVDYALIGPSNPNVFIEVKRPTENLETHQQQLLDYCFQIGVKLSVLTNGFTWWFYLPLQEGSWAQRRFYTIDLKQQASDAVADKLNIYLSKENVRTGQAYNHAKKTCESEKKRAIVQETLPKAWGKLVSEPDELLLDLISQTTEQMCGFRPEVDDIAGFIHQLATTNPPENPIRPRPFQRPQSPSTNPTTSDLNEDYINKKINCFHFFNIKYSPRNWIELLEIVAIKLYSNHTAEFDKCLELRGTRMRYFSKNKDELVVPKKISNSDFYFEAKLNANSIVRRARDLMHLFGHNDDALKVEIDPDNQ